MRRHHQGSDGSAVGLFRVLSRNRASSWAIWRRSDARRCRGRACRACSRTSRLNGPMNWTQSLFSRWSVERGLRVTRRHERRSVRTLPEVSRGRSSRSSARLVESETPRITVGRGCRWFLARTWAGRLRGMDLTDRSHASSLQPPRIRQSGGRSGESALFRAVSRGRICLVSVVVGGAPGHFHLCG